MYLGKREERADVWVGVGGVGVPNDERKDLERPEVVEKIWTGVVPVYTVLGEPMPGPYNHVEEVPAHVGEYVRERNAREKEYAVAAGKKPAPVKLEKSDGDGD